MTSSAFQGASIGFVALAAILSSYGWKYVSLSTTFSEWDPTQTDVHNFVGMRFAQEGHGSVGINVSLDWWEILELYIIPRSVSWLNAGKAVGSNESVSDQNETPIDIWDARKRSDLSFEKNGFTLVNLKEGNSTMDLIEPEKWKDMDQLQVFHDTYVVPQLQKIYRNATRMVIAKPTVRGGRFVPSPIGAVHSDLLADLDGADRFYAEYPEYTDRKRNMVDGMRRATQPEKYNSTDEDEILEAVVTFWKPIQMATRVCDKPLALMDAQTYLSEDELEYQLHLRFPPFFNLDGLSGVPVYRPERQKWYYYSFMSPDEGLFFIQHSTTRGFFKVPHAAFANINCPPETEPRRSVDYRILVFANNPSKQ